MKKPFGLILLAIGTTLLGALAIFPGATPARAKPATPAVPRIGVNLDFNSDHGSDAAWVDTTKIFRRWGKVGKPWEEDSQLKLSPKGYPLSDAEALSHLHGYPDGTYHLRYHGVAKVTFSGTGVLTSSPSKVGDWTVAKVEVKGIGGGNLIQMRVEQIDAADPIRDIGLIAPGFAPDTKELFRPAFLRRLRPFATIRGMNWMMANDSPIVHWSDRTMPDAFLRTGLTGVAYEELVALANAVHKDLWINIPDRADDDYIRQIAKLLKQSLDPGLQVYVEYSNEIWNAIFGQYRRIVAEGRANRAIRATAEYDVAAEQAAFKTAAAAAIFREVFGTDAKRVRPVLGGHVANPYFLVKALGFLKAKYGDPKRVIAGIAVAPYVTLDPAIDKPGLTTNKLFTAMEGYLEGGLTKDIQKNAALARSHGLPLLAYEAGQHLVAFNPVANADVNESLKQLAQSDPRMGKLLARLMAIWTESGGTLINHYTFIVPESKWGYWGLLPDANRMGSVKWDALMRLVLPAGDATLDGVVDFTDFEILRDHWAGNGLWWEQGDFDGDRTVGPSDLAMLRGNVKNLTAVQSAEVASFEAKQAEERKTKSAKPKAKPRRLLR